MVNRSLTEGRAALPQMIAATSLGAHRRRLARYVPRGDEDRSMLPSWRLGAAARRLSGTA